MAQPDLDQLLALALSGSVDRVRAPQQRPVRTPDEILAAARRARARAVETRLQIRASRERCTASLAQAISVRKRLQAALDCAGAPQPAPRIPA